MSNKKKIGFWSIVLLGINSIIGSGIFLLPNQAMELIGPASLGVILFDMLLVVSIALCFAEVGGMFSKNGGPYVYAKEAFGSFVGFEVGFMKWAIGIIAWATMAVGFVTALSAVWPAAGEGMMKNIIIIVILGGLGIINILGVSISKILNNIITVGKLVPLFIFIAVGIFFIKGANFTPVFPGGVYQGGSFGAAALLIFYAFTGFESIAVAAEDMENPEKNIPKAIITVMIIVSVVYLLIQAVSIGILGEQLALTKTPVADASAVFLGSWGGILVTAGTLISIGGINIAASFITPRTAVALAEDGLLPKCLNKYNKKGTPYIAIIVTVALTIPVALSGSFTKLAAISVVSRFAQYVPTCLSVLVLRKKRPDLKSSFRIPLGPVIPILAVVVSGWLLVQSSMEKILWGLGGLIIGVPIYLLMVNINKKEK
ncbi:APC family permease [Clostridium senegalense]|uniref:APC family permease n=1 Tax=Clostridium senegalense TaxID=1465809 RepID=UPI001C0F507C|nr:APC family permease [Clostridium senegalense]MBU5226872.1 APC family permease [Clostridium senegalense]